MIFVLQMASSTDSDGVTIFKNRLDYVEKQTKLIWIMQKREMDDFKSSLSLGGYEYDNIFNMDETGLFYKAIPSRTYLISGESKVSARGTKQMKAKDRITVIVCTNASRTCKISPAVIGKAKKPRCFQSNPPQLPYYSQACAWNDSVVFNKWWNEIFKKKIGHGHQIL